MHTVQLLVADEMMPEMRGTELLARTRAQHPDVVGMLLTGHMNVDVALRAINDARVHRVTVKPCRALELAVAIRKALGTDRSSESETEPSSLDDLCPDLAEIVSMSAAQECAGKVQGTTL